MDVVVLGVMAIVLIAITLWLVIGPLRSTDSVDADARAEEAATTMTPQGDEFEDQYTSATADLSAGGVAATLSGSMVEASQSPERRELGSTPTAFQAAGEPWSSTTIAREEWIGTAPAAAGGTRARPTVPDARKIGLGGAALVTLAGAVGGAWLFARWQRRRNRPLDRLKRTLIK